jgi:hypothetical protein
MAAKIGSALAISEPQELTVHDFQDRICVSHVALHSATVLALVLALLGVQPVFCAALPAAVVGIPTALWAWRDLRALKRRKALREARRDGAR